MSEHFVPAQYFFSSGNEARRGSVVLYENAGRRRVGVYVSGFMRLTEKGYPEWYHRVIIGTSEGRFAVVDCDEIYEFPRDKVVEYRKKILRNSR